MADDLLYAVLPTPKEKRHVVLSTEFTQHLLGIHNLDLMYRYKGRPETPTINEGVWEVAGGEKALAGGGEGKKRSCGRKETEGNRFAENE